MTVSLAEQLYEVVDERTLEIVELRRRSRKVPRRGWIVRRLLVSSDVIGLLVAMLVAEWVVTATTSAGAIDARGETLALIATLPGWVLAAKLYGLYDRDEERTDHTTTDDIAGVFHMVTVCTWMFWALSWATRIVRPTPDKLLIFWAAAIVLLSVGRAIARSVARRNVFYLQNALVVGAGQVGQMMARKFIQHPEYGVNVVGFVDRRPRERTHGLEHLALLGGPERIPAIVDALDIERVVIAFSNEPDDETLELIRTLKQLDVQIDIVPRLFEMVGPSVGVHTVEGLPLVSLPPLRLSRSSAFVKRALDMTVAGAALIALAPLLVLTALAVWLETGSPVLYRHERVGQGKRRIEVLKFRTMHLSACRGSRYGGEEAESLFRDLMLDPARRHEFATAQKLADDPRVTKVGRLLRRTSVDELPQLLNVLKGDISLVGPRPVTVEELERYGDRVDELLASRPGVTGYWQINGRSRLDYEDRVRLDLGYVSSWSLRLDLKILAKTVRVLFVRGDAL